MPIRKEGFETDGVYHIVNRGVDRRPTFTSEADYIRFLSLLGFYRQTQRVPFSVFNRLRRRRDYQQNPLVPKVEELHVEIHCFCIMPNHFHLLLRQKRDRGISVFLQLIQNGYTKYFNARHTRSGHLFAGQFRAVRIPTDALLLHISRYIHLNPFASGLTDDVASYPWSSLPLYLAPDQNHTTSEVVQRVGVERKLLTSMLPPSQYTEFVMDHASYARELERIKHLALEGWSPVQPPRLYRRG